MSRLIAPVAPPPPSLYAAVPVSAELSSAVSDASMTGDGGCCGAPSVTLSFSSNSFCTTICHAHTNSQIALHAWSENIATCSPTMLGQSRSPAWTMQSSAQARCASSCAAKCFEELTPTVQFIQCRTWENQYADALAVRVCAGVKWGIPDHVGSWHGDSIAPQWQSCAGPAPSGKTAVGMACMPNLWASEREEACRQPHRILFAIEIVR